MASWQEYAKFFIALVGIVDPLGSIPVFMNLTAGQSAAERHRAGRMTALAAGAVLVVALVGGEAVLAFLGISIASFQVGGGILILLMAISMMHTRVLGGGDDRGLAPDNGAQATVAVVPLGVPLLAGPGAISAVIFFSHRYTTPSHYALLLTVILAVTLCIWASLRAAHFLAELLGRTGINIVTRIMGLFMAAIGVEFIVQGLKLLFPGWG